MKKKIFEIIEPDANNSLASSVFDRFITLLIVSSVSVVFVSTFALPPEIGKAMQEIEQFASIVFTIEYALRLWTADCKFPGMHPCVARLRYAVSGMAMIDLLAILPFWLPMFMPGSLLGIRALRLVRLFRILKLNRYCMAMSGIEEVIREKRREILGSLFFLSILMLVSSLVIYSVEHDAQPEVFKNAFSGLWWAVATLSTVGYGDIYPVTAIGRVFGALIALLGVAAVAVPTSIISSGLLERISQKKSAEKKPPLAYCPYCGKSLPCNEG